MSRSSLQTSLESRSYRTRPVFDKAMSALSDVRALKPVHFSRNSLYLPSLTAFSRFAGPKPEIGVFSMF